MKIRWTFIEIVLIIIGMLLVVSAVANRCDAAELPMKIDTTGIDTVAWEWEEVKISCGDYDKLHDSPGFHLEPRAGHWKTIKIPILEYTTDTTYRLTEEQLKLLTVPAPTDNAIRTIPDFTGGLYWRYFPPDTVLTIDILNARIDSLVKVVDGLRSLIIFHRSSPTDHNIRSYNDSIRPEWNLGKPLKQKTPDRE